MRSDLVFGATTHVSNRFLLSKALAKATRKLRRRGTCVQDTTNEALARFGWANPIAQCDTVPIAASIPAHHSRPLVGITQQSKHLNVPAVLESPHSIAEALQLSGNWANG
jgi:hypothetical protein